MNLQEVAILLNVFLIIAASFLCFYLKKYGKNFKTKKELHDQVNDNTQLYDSSIHEIEDLQGQIYVIAERMYKIEAQQQKDREAIADHLNELIKKK